MPTPQDLDAALMELRRYRELCRRRDSVVRLLGANGVPPAQIAAAMGKSVSLVKDILAG